MMALQNFVDGVGPVVASAWLNPVDQAINGTAAGQGAALVPYLPPGTGAVSRTVSAKLQESVSVLDFGAVPATWNGSAWTGTDSTAAIQACINALPLGAKMSLSGGAYLISSPLTWATNFIHIEGSSGNDDGAHQITSLLIWNGSSGVAAMYATNPLLLSLNNFQIRVNTGKTLTVGFQSYSTAGSSGEIKGKNFRIDTGTGTLVDGILIGGTYTGDAGENLFEGVQINGATQSCIHYQTVANVIDTYRKCHFIANSTTGSAILVDLGAQPDIFLDDTYTFGKYGVQSNGSATVSGDRWYDESTTQMLLFTTNFNWPRSIVLTDCRGLGVTSGNVISINGNSGGTSGIVLVGGKFSAGITTNGSTTTPVIAFGTNIVGAVTVPTPNLYSFIAQDGTGNGVAINAGIIRCLMTAVNSNGFVVNQGVAYGSWNAAATALLNLIRLNSANATAIGCNSASLYLENVNTATTATAGTSGALPTQVVGYLDVNINGTLQKIPYYAV